jgi:hypothetical protein
MKKPAEEALVIVAVQEAGGVNIVVKGPRFVVITSGESQLVYLAKH